MKTLDEILKACEVKTSEDRIARLKTVFGIEVTAEQLSEYDNKVLAAMFNPYAIAEMIGEPVVMEKVYSSLYARILQTQSVNPGDLVEIPNPFTDKVNIYALVNDTLTSRLIAAGGYSTVTTSLFVTEDISIKLSVLQSQRYDTIPIYRAKLGEYLDRADDYYTIQAINTSIAAAVANIGTTRTISGDFTWNNFKAAARMIDLYSTPVTIIGTLKNLFKIAEWVDSNGKRVITTSTIESLVKAGGAVPVMGAQYIVVRGQVTIGGVVKTIVDDQTVYILGEPAKVGWFTRRRLAGTGQERTTVVKNWTEAANQANAILTDHSFGVEDRSVDVYDSYCMVKINIPAGS